MSDGESPPPEKPKRVVGRPFPKGASGNPGGRPKNGPRLPIEIPTDLEKAIKDAAPKAVALLVCVMESEGEDTRDRITAAKTLLDKVAANAAPVPTPDPTQKQREEEIEDFVSAIRAKPPGGENPDVPS